MPAILSFSMSGLPQGKGRHNFDTRGRFPRAYTPAKTARYEASVRRIAERKMDGRPPIEGGVGVAIRFRLPIPKSASKRTKAAMAAGEIAHVTKPDFDNMTKAILDAFNKVVFRDDSQVCRAFIEKVYAERPGVDVRVEALAPQEGVAA